MVMDNKALVPAHLPRDHPLITQEYSLYTQSIDDMAGKIAGWLDDQVDGGTVYGPSRFGKSSAVNNWLQTLLSERHRGFVPMVIWSHIDAGANATIGRLCSHLLEASRHHLQRAPRSPEDRQRMLIERLATLAMQGGGRFVVLVIDEAQGMSQREWLWLVQIHSQLAQHRIRLCVISIASLQFFDEPISMSLSGGAHVAARFMLVSERFNGIRSCEELRFVMRGYDEGSEWPENSGISFTASVAEQAWLHGFRLQDHADDLWSALNRELPENYQGSIEFPMKTVAHVCRNILLRLAGGADWDYLFKESALRSIVAASGHKQLMGLVGALAPRAGRR